MKLSVYFLALIFLLAACANSQNRKHQDQLTGNIPSDLKVLLPGGKAKADIMDSILQTPRHAELMKRFQNAVQENYEWFVDYMKTIPAGEPMPYTEKSNLTKEEYTELMGFMQNSELVSSGNEEIIINADDQFIHFKSKNKLAVLDSLSIDIKNNLVLFKQYKLPFADTINVTTEENGLKSKWKGYGWKFENPNNLDINAFKDLSNLNFVQCSFRIGKLEKNGKTHMSLKEAEVHNGEKTVSYEIAVQF